MHVKSKNDCRRFEQCELVIAGLLGTDQSNRQTVHNCLFYLYGDDCAGWLERAFGRRPPGLTDRHNAYHAFHDACMALEFAILGKRFNTRDNSNACRSYIYRAAKLCYLKLQFTRNRKNEFTDITDAENSPLYPKPEFIFPLEKAQRKTKVVDLINDMPDKCRELLLLRYVEGLKISEITAKTGLERKQVTKRLFDCKNKLKYILPDTFNENY